jgi:hypothetical protein
MPAAQATEAALKCARSETLMAVTPRRTVRGGVARDYEAAAGQQARHRQDSGCTLSCRMLLDGLVGPGYGLLVSHGVY